VDELITWLRKQLDDDDRVAQGALHPDAVNPGSWITEHHNSEYHDEPNRCHIAEDKGGHYWSVAHEVFVPNAEHMARWDPARVLAEVDAKRERLTWIEGELGDDPTDEAAQWLAKLEGMPFAGRPGWREEWRA
jgi:hypothetical protein